ncbi:uncharacterized protein [Atheta coriaria]|uniref:uncharacterized protein n=1 Tax=Dalotia coriaria TaxID=877792 RepID=UPI0031F38029
MRRSATRATGQRVHSLHTHTRAEKKAIRADAVAPRLIGPSRSSHPSPSRRIAFGDPSGTVTAYTQRQASPTTERRPGSREPDLRSQLRYFYNCYKLYAKQINI